MYKILVADDEQKIREVIREYAEFEGHEVAEAVDGMQAVEMAKELIEKGKKATDASKEVASLTGFKKNEIYKELL